MDGTTGRETRESVQLARPDDLAGIEAWERAAGDVFRTLGMELIADDAPVPIAHLAG